VLRGETAPAVRYVPPAKEVEEVEGAEGADEPAAANAPAAEVSE